MTAPPGYCQCGCGQKAPICKKTDRSRGYVAGQPLRFLNGHNKRGATRPLTERFWEKVDKEGPGGCWLWIGARLDLGYGVFWVDGATVRAHRYSYELAEGPIPDGLVLDHLCRNPPCVNPAHLEPVQQRENIMRGIGFAPENAAKTHCKYGHPLTEENVYRRSNGGRLCKVCQRASVRRTEAKRKARATS